MFLLPSITKYNSRIKRYQYIDNNLTSDEGSSLNNTSIISLIEDNNIVINKLSLIATLVVNKPADKNIL